MAAVRVRLLLAVLIFVGALGLYVVTAPPGMIYEGGVSVDSAELQRVANRLGIAHSTGYPLYTMLGYLAARLGEALGQSPYAWITYFSGLMSAAALVLFYLTALRVGSLPAALAATLVLAVSNTYWHMSTITEVQGLQAVIVVGILYLTLRYVDHPKVWWPLVGVAVLVGMGLSNHRMIVLVFPAVGVALLSAHFWRHLRWWQIAALGVIALLPLLSHLYIYWRATDPFVVYGTRLTWIPVNIQMQDMTNLIRGTFQDGQGLEANMVYEVSQLGVRLRMVLGRATDELTVFGALLGGIGLIAMLRRRWGLPLVVYLGVLVVFLMGWRVDEKAQIYNYLLVFPLLLGAVYVLSLPAHRWRRAALGLPLVMLAVGLVIENAPARNLRGDVRDAELRAQIRRLDAAGLFYTGVWQPELFITLEYLDDTQARGPVPVGTNLWWVPLDDMRDLSKTVYIGNMWRSQYGLYGGATWFQEEQDIAFSGTNTEMFLQARPADDPRLIAEAEGATHIGEAITPDITLYSFNLVRTTEGIEVTLYWQAQADVQAGYSVYAHLRFYHAMCDLSQGVELLSQDDAAMPVKGAYPTQLWSAGQIIKDTYFLPWPEEPVERGVAFTVGMTDHNTGERQAEFCLRLPRGYIPTRRDV
ncbi:MAG: hypothetical protein OHK0046_22260 [Anaerolineae bacterium]